MDFQWDTFKAQRNLEKHGITFEETKTVFFNPLAVIFDDDIHSIQEQREIILGHSIDNRLLLVAFTEKFNYIRIISAHLATKKECIAYEESNF